MGRKISEVHRKTSSIGGLANFLPGKGALNKHKLAFNFFFSSYPCEKKKSLFNILYSDELAIKNINYEIIIYMTGSTR